MSRDRPNVGQAPIGFAWYTRETWERLRESADDREALDDTFEEWERQAVGAFRELESIRRSVRKVPVDIDAVVAWCRKRGRRFDSAARSEYVAQLLRRSADGRTKRDHPGQ